MPASAPQTFAMGAANVTLYAAWAQTGPRYFAYVANAGSNTVSAHSIEASTGTLTAVTGSPFAAGTSPWSIVTVKKN